MHGYCITYLLDATKKKKDFEELAKWLLEVEGIKSEDVEILKGNYTLEMIALSCDCFNRTGD